MLLIGMPTRAARFATPTRGHRAALSPAPSRASPRGRSVSSSAAGITSRTSRHSTQALPIPPVRPWSKRTWTTGGEPFDRFRVGAEGKPTGTARQRPSENSDNVTDDVLRTITGGARAGVTHSRFRGSYAAFPIPSRLCPNQVSIAPAASNCRLARNSGATPRSAPARARCRSLPFRGSRRTPRSRADTSTSPA